MIYDQAVNYVQNLEKFGSVFGLDTVRLLLNRLGDPQKSIKFIHIAGTNGKGSTSCFITNILIESGYKVGTFNSPSVFRYNERFLIDGSPICDTDVAKYISAVADEREKMKSEGLNAPTAFEVEFAAAMLCFKEKQCDFAVLECGLGGRLDATNAIDKKEVAIITSISFDHTAVLGNTLGAIAAEKAAIVKDCPLVTYRQCDEVMKVFEKADDLRVCPQSKLISSDKDRQIFSYRGETFELKQLGKYQLDNCSAAIEGALTLIERGHGKITWDTIKRGVSKSVWKGRLQKIEKKGKTFLLDGAHNPDGAKTLADELSSHFSDMKKCFVFGMFADKDIDGVLKNIGGLADMFIAVKPPSKRGLDEKITLEKCLQYATLSSSAPSIEEAITAALNGACELIVVCGSLSILNNALKAIESI